MKFSVLLNNFNYGQYLRDTIESVLNQTHSDFEFIIVDDGSTDGSRAVIASFTDERIIAVLKENGGQGSAFKAGFALATGDYIAFLDADDLWDANKLQVCHEALLREPDIVLLNHNFRQIDGCGNIIPESRRLNHFGIYDLKADLRRYSIEFSLVPTSFFLGRREQCLQLTFDDHEWRTWADTPVIISLALSGKVYNISDILGSYRVHGSNLSNLWMNGAECTGTSYLRPGFMIGDNKENLFPLYLYHQRFYQIANENMARSNLEERFDFSKTDVFRENGILSTSIFSPAGFWLRLKRWASSRSSKI